jgi:general secretion pathway protein G
MKVRCPHCREVFDPLGRPRCARCGRSVLLPGFYGARAQRANSGAPWRSRWTAAPGVALLRKPLRIVIAVLVLCAVGAALLRQAGKGSPRSAEGDRATARRNMEVLYLALDQLRGECGRFPTTAEGLVSVVHDPGMGRWDGPYVIELKPDPWGQAFGYASDGQRVLLTSAGPDGTNGTPDDLQLDAGAGAQFDPPGGSVPITLVPPAR